MTETDGAIPEAIKDIRLELRAELGRRQMSVGELAALALGSVVELDALAGSELCVYANGRLVAKGEAVMVNDKYGVRLTEICLRGPGR